MSVISWLLYPSAASGASSSGSGRKEGECLSEGSEEEPLSAADRANRVKIWLAHLYCSQNKIDNLRRLVEAEGYLWSFISGKYSHARELELRRLSLWCARYLEHLVFEADQPLLPVAHFKQSKSMRITGLYDYVGIGLIMHGKPGPTWACTPTHFRLLTMR